VSDVGDCHFCDYDGGDVKDSIKRERETLILREKLLSLAASLPDKKTILNDRGFRRLIT
jgi:hypothetical protein